MADKETSNSSRYPQRIKRKVDYSEFEMSMEIKGKKANKLLEDDVSFKEEEDEKENNNTNEIEENETEEISEYEKLRLKNLEENKRMMMEMGLLNTVKEQTTKVVIKPKITREKVARRSTPKGIEPTKRSLRLLGKTPDGKNIPLKLLELTPSESPTGEAEKKTRFKEEVLPMNEDGESSDFLDSLKASLSQESTTSSLESTDRLIKDMRDLQFAACGRVTNTRAQSMCVHPMESKLLVIMGSKNGELGLWNVDRDEIAHFTPHVRAINCISVDTTDQSKIFTTSFDGTVRKADINKSVFDLVYQTDEKSNMCHITWHTQIDHNTLIVAHGTGEAGIVDMRAKTAQRWFHCHPRSIRTTQLHPSQPHYFITASGTGECKVWDVRGSKKHVDECIGTISGFKKGLTSAFFSPDGTKVVSVSNDDFIYLHDTTDLANPRVSQMISHNNHTGRWLSVFKAVWHPYNSDLFFVGSLLQPRRIQLFSGSGHLVKEVMADQLTTAVPVIAIHPTQPVVVGGNSTGKAHLFTTSQFLTRYIPPEDDVEDRLF